MLKKERAFIVELSDLLDKHGVYLRAHLDLEHPHDFAISVANVDDSICLQFVAKKVDSAVLIRELLHKEAINRK